MSQLISHPGFWQERHFTLQFQVHKKPSYVLNFTFKIQHGLSQKTLPSQKQIIFMNVPENTTTTSQSQHLLWKKILKSIKPCGHGNKVDVIRYFYGLKSKELTELMITHHALLLRQYFQNEIASPRSVVFSELDKYYAKKNSFQVPTSL